jgi:hypothetical protein
MNQILTNCNRLSKIWLWLQQSSPESTNNRIETVTKNSSAQIEAYLQEDDNKPVSGVTLFLYGDDD